MAVDVLIPWSRSRDPDRIASFLYVVKHYDAHHPWDMHLGLCEGEWSKGAALRDAAARSTADVLVIADADSYLDPDALTFAVQALPPGGWCVPHLDVFRLSRTASRAVYDGLPPNHDHRHAWRVHRGPPGGGITILHRSAWDTVGGVDPRFMGWGGEDICFGWALHTLVGRPLRFRNPLTHLWHEPAAPRGDPHAPRGSEHSEQLVERYRAARNDPADMAALVAEHQETSCPTPAS